MRRKKIPKPDGGVRKLGIPTVVDRVIQQGIAQRLQNIWEPLFSDSSYGYRPRRSGQQAIPVSYTHLGDAPVGGTFRRKAPADGGAGTQPDCDVRGPVSYTHLDVYKRQNPRWGRFVNADMLIQCKKIGSNLFAYCSNRPILFSDANGTEEYLSLIHI